MRHLFVVVDMSRAMEEADLKPSRLACSVKVLYISLSLALRILPAGADLHVPVRCRKGGGGLQGVHTPL